GAGAVPTLSGLIDALAFGLAKAGVNRALAHRVRLARAGRAAMAARAKLTMAAVWTRVQERASVPPPPRLKDPAREPLLLVGDLFAAPGPGEAEEAELKWEKEPGGQVSEQRGLEAAEHEARLLACAVPVLRILHHCLCLLAGAGLPPPSGSLDPVGPLLDLEATLALLPLDPPSNTP
ncbi:unnamed protein product, partial [Choristocarpus tenellus]